MLIESNQHCIREVIGVVEVITSHSHLPAAHFIHLLQHCRDGIQGMALVLFCKLSMFPMFFTEPDLYLAYLQPCGSSECTSSSISFLGCEISE